MRLLAHLVVQHPGQVLPLRLFHLRQPGRQGPELVTFPDNLLLRPLAFGDVLQDHQVLVPDSGAEYFGDANRTVLAGHPGFRRFNIRMFPRRLSHGLLPVGHAVVAMLLVGIGAPPPGLQVRDIVEGIAKDCQETVVQILNITPQVDNGDRDRR